MLERAKRRAELVGKLYNLRMTEMGQAMADYIWFLIQGIREENDNAPAENILLNQGKISALKSLYSDITKGLPNRE